MRLVPEIFKYCMVELNVMVVLLAASDVRMSCLF